jgi:protocatechuate 3,4-dioxygenase beta subunit
VTLHAIPVVGHLAFALFLALPVQPPVPGKAVITGVVTAADTARPLPGAIVTLTGPVDQSRLVVTDDDGRFTFEELEPGRYRLGARPGSAHAQYLPGRYGAARAGDPGTPIVLSAGERRADADVSLPRGAIVEGRVLSTGGAPVAGVRVTARSARSARPAEGSRSADASDDLGRFRLFGLAPAEVVLVAEPPAQLVGALTNGATEADLTTYFPSALVEREATRIRLDSASDVSDVTIRLRRSRTFTVSGTVTDSSGDPAPWLRLALVPASASVPGRTFTGPGDGTFTIRGVLPGAYRLVARAGPVDAPREAHGPAALEFGRLDLNVSGNLEGLAITTAPGATLTGRIVFPGDAPDEPSRWMRVTAHPPGPGGLIDPRSSAAVGEDLRFMLRDLFGPLLVRVSESPAGYALESVRLGSADITDEPADFASAGDSSLEVVLTNRLASVDALVLDPDGEPATQAVVVLVPELPAERALHSTRLRMAIVTGDGRVRIENALPGAYRAIALRSGQLDFDPDSGPAWLEAMLPQGVYLSLEAGSRQIVTVQLAPR